MARVFGTWITRLLRGGTTLTAVEDATLSRLLDALPPHLAPVVRAQFEAYDLVQREVDGRALNFYRTGGGGRPLPLLPGPPAETTLLRLTLAVGGMGRLHATLGAAGGRAFRIGFSARPDPAADAGSLEVLEVTQSWRSAYPATMMDQ